jgi:hypothetical protein
MAIGAFITPITPASAEMQDRAIAAIERAAVEGRPKANDRVYEPATGGVCACYLILEEFGALPEISPSSVGDRDFETQVYHNMIELGFNVSKVTNANDSALYIDAEFGYSFRNVGWTEVAARLRSRQFVVTG